MCLELGVIPVKYVRMAKHVSVLHYILSESMSSLPRKVYDTIKCDSRKGDFFQSVRMDMDDLDILLTEEEILVHTNIVLEITFIKEI